MGQLDLGNLICPSQTLPSRKEEEITKTVGERVNGDGNRFWTLRAGIVSDGQIR